MVESDGVADFMSDDTELYAKLDFILCAEDYEMHFRSHVTLGKGTLQFQLNCTTGKMWEGKEIGMGRVKY